MGVAELVGGTFEKQGEMVCFFDFFKICWFEAQQFCRSVWFSTSLLAPNFSKHLRNYAARRAGAKPLLSNASERKELSALFVLDS